MANRLSLQSATCSAFQLQLCRQPHNDNGTKTVSSFGSDCTRAMQSPHTQSYNLMRHHWALAYSQTVLVSDINSVREKLRLRLFLFMCTFAFVQYESMPIWAREWRCLSYCSAVMYPSSCGVHCTPATSTLPSSSEKDRPRFRPWMVTSVPPSRGPATGLTYIGCRKK